jgi:hypothetical protein
MGNRYLEVFQGKRSEYYAAVASVSHSFCSKKSSWKCLAKADNRFIMLFCSNIITGMGLGGYWVMVLKNKQVSH